MQPWPKATAKHRHNTSVHFRQKKLELLPESLKLKGNIFLELFLGDLDEKMTSTGYKRERNKKHTRQWEEPIIYSPRG